MLIVKYQRSTIYSKVEFTCHNCGGAMWFVDFQPRVCSHCSATLPLLDRLRESKYYRIYCHRDEDTDVRSKNQHT